MQFADLAKALAAGFFTFPKVAGLLDLKTQSTGATLPVYGSNALAIAGGLTVGKLYRNGDNICVVH
jgi:hypothetical protein